MKFKDKPIEEKVAIYLGRMTAKEADFDTVFEKCVELVKPLARRIHATMRFEQHVLGPVQKAMEVDATKAAALIGSMSESAEAMKILNNLHQDSLATTKAVGYFLSEGSVSRETEAPDASLTKEQ